MYLLHDKNADTDERVAWTETRNLATHDPDLAWRVMAATAMDAQRLKQMHHEAQQEEKPEEDREPFRITKSSHNHVFHYALTWHKEEEPFLSRDEMMRCALGSIRELKAEGLQALIVAHQPTDHENEKDTNPHVHVMLNRVDPQTGKIRPIDSNAARNLSRFALKYSREFRATHGTPDYAEERESNALKRKNRVPYEAKKRIKRADFERMREGVKREAMTRKDGKEVRLDPARAEALRKSQAEADHRLARDERGMTERHRGDWHRLVSDHKAGKAHIVADANEANGRAKREIAQAYEPKWRAIRDAQEAEKRAMVERERSLAGKVQNTVSALKSIWGEHRETDARQVVAETFSAIGSQGGRMAALEKAQKKAQRVLAGAEKAELGEALTGVEARRKAAIHHNYERHLRERERLMRSQAEDRGNARQAWRDRGVAKLAAWQSLALSERHRQDHRAAVGRPDVSAAHGAGDGTRVASAKTRTRTRRTRTRE